MSYRDDPPALTARRRGAYLPLLDRLSVKTPCRERWAAMVGDDRVRHCKVCDRQVFNVAAMTTVEVERLVASVAAGDAVCGRLYRRPDGTVVTAECVAARARTRVWAARAVGLGAALAAAGIVIAIATTGAEAVNVDGLFRGKPTAIAPEPYQVAREPPMPVESPQARERALAQALEAAHLSGSLGLQD